MNTAAIDPILDLCTWYPLQLGGLRQCGIQSLPETLVHMAKPGSRTPDLLILSPVPYPPRHMFSICTNMFLRTCKRLNCGVK